MTKFTVGIYTVNPTVRSLAVPFSWFSIVPIISSHQLSETNEKNSTNSLNHTYHSILTTRIREGRSKQTAWQHTYCLSLKQLLDRSQLSFPWCCSVSNTHPTLLTVSKHIRHCLVAPYTVSPAYPTYMYVHTDPTLLRSFTKFATNLPGKLVQKAQKCKVKKPSAGFRWPSW